MYFAEKALRLGAPVSEVSDWKEDAVQMMTAKKPPSSDDVELGKKAIAGVSFLANRHDHLFCSTRLQTFFRDILSGLPLEFSPTAIGDLQCIILDCLTNFLVDEEKQMLANDAECEFCFVLNCKFQFIPWPLSWMPISFNVYVIVTLLKAVWLSILRAKHNVSHFQWISKLFRGLIGYRFSGPDLLADFRTRLGYTEMSNAWAFLPAA